MPGLGTVINTIAVLVGGWIGMRFQTALNQRMQTALMQACGIATILMGIGGTMAKMLTVTADGINTQGTLLLILSLVFGALLGEWMDLEARMEQVGERLKAALRRDGDSQFVEGFVNVSLIICVGAMAIVGSIQDGISGDFSMLAAKAVLDLMIVMVFAATYGLGALCSAAAIFIYQGGITLLAACLGSFASDSVIDALSYVGSALIFCVGVNICFGKRIRVGNFLPALVFAVLFQVLSDWLGIVPF